MAIVKKHKSNVLLNPKYFKDEQVLDGAQVIGAVDASVEGAAHNDRGTFITGAVVTLVLSLADITDCFRGRISGKQLLKNVITKISGLGVGAAGGIVGAKAGGLAGVEIGMLFGPAGSAIGLTIGTTAGGIAGTFAGGTAGGKAGHMVMSNFIEDDAVEMVTIINKRLVPLVQSYLLSKEELKLVIDDLKNALERGKLLEMFVSRDRNKFADDMLTEIIEKTICWRCRVILPNAEEVIKGIGRVLELSNNEFTLQAHLVKTEINAVEMGQCP